VATTVSNKANPGPASRGKPQPHVARDLGPGVVPSAGSNSPDQWGRNDYNDVTIDGTSVIVPENNVSHLQIGYIPNEDSVQELSVVTNSLASRIWRTGGGTINIATRSGANQPHLTLFEFFRNNVLNAIAGATTGTDCREASFATTSLAAPSAALFTFPRL